MMNTNINHSIQQMSSLGLAAYWSNACLPVLNSKFDRGTEIRSRVREGWDD